MRSVQGCLLVCLPMRKLRGTTRASYLPRKWGGPLPHEAAAGRVVSRDGSMAQPHTGTVMRAMFAGSIALWSKAATIAKVRPRPRPVPDRPSSQLAPFLCSFRPADRVTSRDCPTHRPEAAWLPRLRSPPRERVPPIPATRPSRRPPRTRSEPRSGLKTPNSPLYTILEPNDSD